MSGWTLASLSRSSHSRTEQHCWRTISVSRSFRLAPVEIGEDGAVPEFHHVQPPPSSASGGAGRGWALPELEAPCPSAVRVAMLSGLPDSWSAAAGHDHPGRLVGLGWARGVARHGPRQGLASPRGTPADASRAGILLLGRSSHSREIYAAAQTGVAVVVPRDRPALVTQWPGLHVEHPPAGHTTSSRR